MKIITPLLIFLMPCAGYSSEVVDDGSGVFYASEQAKACFSIGVSSGIQGCMQSLAAEKKINYEKEYGIFTKKIREANWFSNPQEFLKLISAEKKNWDAYINYKCLARASLSIKKSYDYYTIQSACMAYEYNNRAKYYLDYANIKEITTK